MACSTYIVRRTINITVHYYTKVFLKTYVSNTMPYLGESNFIVIVSVIVILVESFHPIQELR